MKVVRTIVMEGDQGWINATLDKCWVSPPSPQNLGAGRKIWERRRRTEDDLEQPELPLKENFRRLFVEKFYNLLDRSEEKDGFFSLQFREDVRNLLSLLEAGEKLLQLGGLK